MSLDFKRLLSHDAGPAAQFMKYAVAGGLATAVNIIAFYLLGWRFLPCLAGDDVVARLAFKFLGLRAAVAAESARAAHAACCNAIAFFASNAVCYLLNRLFVFRPGRHGVVVEALMFFGVSAASVFLGTVIQTWLIRSFGLQTTLAFCANIATSLAINYAMRKFVVFKG